MRNRRLTHSTRRTRSRNVIPILSEPNFGMSIPAAIMQFVHSSKMSAPGTSPGPGKQHAKQRFENRTSINIAYHRRTPGSRSGSSHHRKKPGKSGRHKTRIHHVSKRNPGSFRPGEGGGGPSRNRIYGRRGMATHAPSQTISGHARFWEGRKTPDMPSQPARRPYRAISMAPETRLASVGCLSRCLGAHI